MLAQSAPSPAGSAFPLRGRPFAPMADVSSRALAWLAQPPQSAVATAARTGHWRPAIQWALTKLHAEFDNSRVADSLGLTMTRGGQAMRDWLRIEVIYPEAFWDQERSSAVTKAYDLLLQQPPRRGEEERQAMSRIAVAMRDVIVVAAIFHAGTHTQTSFYSTIGSPVSSAARCEILYLRSWTTATASS